MAVINVEVNIKDNSLIVTLNGSVIPNVTDFTGYRDVDSDGNIISFYVRITTKEKVVDNLTKMVEYWSYGSPQAQAAISLGDFVTREDLPDFIGVPCKSAVQKDIEAFFAKNK